MNGSGDRSSRNGGRDELREAIRALLRLREEEIRLLRRIEEALGSEEGRPAPAAGAAAAGSAVDLPEWLGQEVDSALARAFGGGDALEEEAEDEEAAGDALEEEAEDEEAAGDALEEEAEDEEAAGDVTWEDPEEEVTVRDRSEEPVREGEATYLLLGSAQEWVGFPWIEVERVELAEGTAGAEAGPSLRQVLGQAEGIEGPEPYRIRFAHGAGSLSCQSVGGIVTLEEAARRGVEGVLMPHSIPGDGGMKITLLPLVEAAVRAATPGPVPSAAEPQSPPGLVPVSDQRVDPEGDPCAGEQAVPEPPVEMESGGSVGGSRHLVPAGLVAIRYLPARVSVTRALREQGWFLRETVNPAEVPSRLRKVRYHAVFVEIVEEEIPDLVPALKAALANGCRVVAVGSRLRGSGHNPLRDLGEIPRLLYPFQESEFERILAGIRGGRPD